MRDQVTPLVTFLLTPAAGTGLLPMAVLTATQLILGHVPGMMLGAGLWTMIFSIFIAAASLVIAWLEAHMCQ